jgi:hypothetical protein
LLVVSVIHPSSGVSVLFFFFWCMNTSTRLLFIVSSAIGFCLITVLLVALVGPINFQCEIRRIWRALRKQQDYDVTSIPSDRRSDEKREPTWLALPRTQLAAKEASTHSLIRKAPRRVTARTQNVWLEMPVDFLEYTNGVYSWNWLSGLRDNRQQLGKVQCGPSL